LLIKKYDHNTRLDNWLKIGVLVAIFLIPLLTTPAMAHSGDVLSALATVTPTIDGTISAGEWDDAATITFDLIDTAETHSTTLLVKNDKDFLFLAVLIHDDYNAWGLDPFKQGDGFDIFFDNDHDGGIRYSNSEPGDDAILAKVGNPTLDSFFHISPNGGLSYQGDGFTEGTNDMISSIFHTNSTEGAVGDYTFELSKELNSGDVEHDFILSAGSTVGVFLTFIDTPLGQGAVQLSWPGPNECTRFPPMVPCVGADIVIHQIPNEGSQIISSTIPSWIKNNAKWWSDGQIGDSDFVDGIQFMIKEKIINTPNLPEQASETAEEKVPDWIRNNAGWWADGLITEDDFVNGIQYLIEQGIIKV